MSKVFENYYKIYNQMTQEMKDLMFELLVHKYLYYEMDRPIITDYEYDMLEHKWIKMLEDAGINMDDYPFWIGFPEEHPMAAEAAKVAKKRIGISV